LAIKGLSKDKKIQNAQNETINWRFFRNKSLCYWV